MRTGSRRLDRRETNPAFSSRKLKLGTFQTNLDSGCVMSDLDGRLDITWPNTIALARLAEEMEFEALVPASRRIPGPPGLRPRPASPACSPPRIFRSIIRSSRPSSRR
jgi:hypothetical protein